MNADLATGAPVNSQIHLDIKGCPVEITLNYSDLNLPGRVVRIQHRVTNGENHGPSFSPIADVSQITVL